jgi:hypothetical protein
MRKKIICLIFAAFLLGVADYACGYARWRNLLGDQDFSNPGNFADPASLYGGRIVINGGPGHPSWDVDPPIMSYTPSPEYSPLDVRGPGYNEGTSSEWYITGGYLHASEGWGICYNGDTTGYVEMTGGELVFDEDILCPRGDNSTATVLLHGGTVRTSGLQFKTGGVIDLAGNGKLVVVDSNVVGDVPGWVTAGYITGDGGLGEVHAVYDGDANETTIFASTITAWQPNPSDKAKNVCYDIVLSWTPGALAADTNGHDVYFGTDYNDVEGATTSTAGIYKGRQDSNEYPESGTLALDPGTTYYWRIDEVNDTEVWTGGVWQFTTNDGTAYDPNPGNLDELVPREAVLEWKPGCSATKHKVYFSTDFNDVNDRQAAAYLGEIEPNTIDPCAGDLDFLTIYYWAVDETAGANTWPGQVWTFISEADIVDPNLRLWFEFDQNEGDWVYDSSGRQFNSNDGTVSDRWEPNEGRFGGSLFCDDDIGLTISPKMLVISHGVTVSVWLKDAYRDGDDNIVFGAGDSGDDESLLRGDVPDETGQIFWRAGNDSNDVLTWDLDGSNPELLEGWHQWAFVKNELAGEISIYFDGKVAESNGMVDATLGDVSGKRFKVGASSWSNTDLVGHIDDFRVYDFGMSAKQVGALFRGGELEFAWGPEPFDGQTDLPPDVNLVWLPGDFSDKHDVYLGTDWDDVNDATTSSALIYKGRQDPCDYDPPTDLVLNTTYYWRIDEVNTVDPNLWKGKIWKFTVANFIIVDDFEAYNNGANKIFDTWEDGNVNFTGSFLDLGSEPFDPAHGGNQSMLYIYDNTILWDWDHYWSEIKLPFDPAKDFTSDGLIKVLTLYFYGDPDNDANDTEELYVGLTGSLAEVRYRDDHGNDNNDLKLQEWTEWNIPLSDFNDPDPVDPCVVTGLLIGFGDRDNTSVVGGDGVVYFDNVRLYPPRCRPELGPALDFSGNCIVDWADVRLMVVDWLATDTLLSPITAPDPCILHYKFDETSGTTATDASGNDYTGTFFDDLDQTPVDITGRSDTGVDGNSFHFTSPEYIGVKMPAEVFTENGISQEITVAVWIKNAHPEEDPDGTAFMWEFREWDGASPDANERVLAVEVSDNGDTYTLLDNSESVSYDLDWDEHTEWQHYGFVRDANNLAIWVNGSVAAVDDSNGTAMATPGLLYVGISADRAPGNTEGMHDGFTGNMDDWKIYNYALPADEMGYLGTDGTGYVPLFSAYDLYDGEPAGQKAVNIRDLAVVLNSWLEEKLWPE